MIVALDTDVLVHWQVAGTVHHEAVAAWISQLLRVDSSKIGLTAQVLCEFIHVVTDPRRLASPMPMTKAVRRSRDLWDAPEVIRLMPEPETFHRTLSLLVKHGLGRKRTLDTMLAATLESAGVSRLATLNTRDYQLFSFLEFTDPRLPIQT